MKSPTLSVSSVSKQARRFDKDVSGEVAWKKGLGLKRKG